MKKVFSTLGILIVLIGGVFSAATYFASLRYVKESDAGISHKISMLTNRFDMKQLNEAIMQINARMWQLEDKHRSSNPSEWNDQKDKDRYRKLKLQLDDLTKKYNELLKKGSK
ncbi:hypothetical protein LCGC14_1398220 [marine sediment metagenome]|uniref:Uncharacterized protein n=1 Tax=marine sediment metagenome TaxID=412755 RepID=A0A0F9KIR6_9ZZZZ